MTDKMAEDQETPGTEDAVSAAPGPTHSGFVALIGPTNAGKSTLLNRLVGAKVSIVSHKVQTTRAVVRGIAIHNNAQIVFMDTPGIFKPRRRLDRAMVTSAWGGAKDADLIKQFIARARTIQPKGQVIIPAGAADSVILQEGDVLYVPEQTSAILVHGEVMFPNAIVWQPGLTAQHYINEVGGYTQSSDKSRLILIRPNGEARLVTASTRIESGDELMVLPKVTAKKMEITRALSTIIYQVAIAAKVILNL